MFILAYSVMFALSMMAAAAAGSVTIWNMHNVTNCQMSIARCNYVDLHAAATAIQAREVKVCPLWMDSH